MIEAIDQRLEVLKIHLPYHESDHVLALAYLPLCGGTCLQDLELLRNDEVVLAALGARRFPDPTTAGDFCRRFSQETIQVLQDIVHDIRIRVCAGQPAAFFAQAIIDRDGFLVETTGQYKHGTRQWRKTHNCSCDIAPRFQVTCMRLPPRVQQCRP